MPPCLTLSIIRYISRVKWSNPGNGVAPSPTPWCSSYWKGSLRSTSTKVANFIYLLTYSYNVRYKKNSVMCDELFIWLIGNLALLVTIATSGCKRKIDKKNLSLSSHHGLEERICFYPSGVFIASGSCSAQNTAKDSRA